MPDTDFNITDEVDDELHDDDGTSTHAGDGDGDGDDTPDRGDEVTPGTGEEGDPDAGGEGGEGEGDDGDPVDPALLAELAGEGGGKTPKVVPYARLAEVTAQNAKLMELLDGFATGRLSTGKPAEAAATADTTPAFDMKAQIKARNAALLEGDEDKAAEIDLAIEEYRNTTIRQAARQEAMQDFTAAQQKAALDGIVTEAFGKYTFLNDQSEDYNEEALDEVMMYRNHYLTKGDSLPQALAKAIEKVCPQYVEGGGEGDGDGGEGAGKPAAAAAAGKRDAAKVLRNARAARSQPPETARAGTANRETIDVSKLDIENMSDDKFDALPADVKARIRGDAVA